MRLNPDLPQKLEDIINKAMEKDCNLRYQHASDLRSDFERVIRDKASSGVTAAETSLTSASATAGPLRPLITRARVVVPVTLLVIAGAVGTFLYTRRAHGLVERDTVVLADFDNHTGDPVFDDTLKQALAVDLEQSSFFNILSDRKVANSLQLMGRKPDERLTQDLARQVYQRSGSKAVLGGSIANLGSQYVVGLNVQPPALGPNPK